MEDKRAITETGRQVILQHDGAWAYPEINPEDASAPDFRKARWGMTAEDVKHVETSELLKATEEGLVFKGQVARWPCLVAYFFDRDRLVRSKYNFTEEYHSPNDYLDDFKRLREILSQKYGDSVQSETRWVDDRYRDDPDCWGKAVALGHLVLWEIWESERTEISLMMRSGEHGILLEIEYSSKDLDKPEPPPQIEDPLADF